MKFVQGPDFPTGALILGRERHPRRVPDRPRLDQDARGRRHRGGRGGGQRIVVTEIPYQTSVEVIGQKIAELVNERKIEGIRDVRNESSGDTSGSWSSCKRDANAQVVLNQLYKHTPMQTNFAREHARARRRRARASSTSPGAIKVYVDHQIDVVRRRTEFRLAKAKRPRAHRRGAGEGPRHDRRDHRPHPGLRPTPTTARTGLMAAPFEFSEIQANYILDMQLRRLAQLEGQKLRDELARAAGDDRRARGDPRQQDEAPRASSRTSSARSATKFADERRTQLTFDSGDLDTLDLIEDEEVVVVLSHKGYVKTVASDAFRRQGRGGRGVRGGNLRDEDYVEHLLTTTAHSYLLFFSNRGRVYRLRAHEIPMKERTARGTAIVNLVALAPEERIQAVIDTRTYEDGAYLFFATRKGQVKKTRMSEYDSSLRTGLIAINLNNGDELVRVMQTNGTDDIFMVSRERHGDSILRVRRPIDGPGHRRRARDEAQERRKTPW